MNQEDLREIGAEGMTQEEVIAYIKRCRREFKFYGPRFLKIQTTGGRLVNFKLNGPQRLLLHIFDEIRKKRLLRAVILKGRRMGVSTLISGRFFQKTALQANRYAMQITHEPDASQFLFRMVKRFYDYSPKVFRPQTKANNQTLLEFNNAEGTGLNSAFRVATAGKDDIGSGQLIHYLHGSEVAKWPKEKIKNILTAVLQTIPKTQQTEILFESTALGIGGEFYDMFWNARYRVWVTRLNRDGLPIIEESINPTALPEDDYTSIFLPWFVFEENRCGSSTNPDLRLPADFSRTKEEEALAKRFGLCDEQLYWRRYTIANECKGSVERFKQEHPSTPEEAFLGTGRPVFDNEKVSKWRDSAPKPIAAYEILGLNFVSNPEGRFKVWQEPRPGAFYLAGADVSEGLASGDASAVYVVDWRSGDQVAEWHGHCAPDELATILEAIGRRYNMAMLAPERNNHGLTVISFLFASKYPNLYAEMVPDPPGKPRKRYGWLTDTKTRPVIIDQLIREVREGTLGAKSKTLFMEMLSFKIQDNGKFEADANRHDDLVIAAGITKHLRQVMPLPRANSIRRDYISPDGTARPAVRGNWA